MTTCIIAHSTVPSTRGNSWSSIFFEPPDIFDCERYSKRNGTLVKCKQMLIPWVLLPWVSYYTYYSGTGICADGLVHLDFCAFSFSSSTPFILITLITSFVTTETYQQTWLSLISYIFPSHTYPPPHSPPEMGGGVTSSNLKPCPSLFTLHSSFFPLSTSLFLFPLPSSLFILPS